MTSLISPSVKSRDFDAVRAARDAAAGRLDVQTHTLYTQQV
jgi:hypothetical protein